MRLGQRPGRGRARPAARSRGCAADLDPPLMETLRLLVTELVTNSVRHADCDALTLGRGRPGRRADRGRGRGPGFDLGPARPRAPTRTTDTGWGLFLVERLAERWGVARGRRAPSASGSSWAAPRASAAGRSGSGTSWPSSARKRCAAVGASSSRLLLKATCTSPACSASAARGRRSPRAPRRRRCQPKRSATDLPGQVAVGVAAVQRAGRRGRRGVTASSPTA